VSSTKATTVLVLGVVALVTGPLVGGMVPAVIALALGRQARADLVAGRGFLTGAERLRCGEILAMVGLGLAAVTLVVGALAAMISIAHGAGLHDFPDTVN
jgi:(hydroxyamino)benzene mutase